MHYLQKAILDKLRHDQPLSYTALMPDHIESSHFRYHLKQLMTDGLVGKDGAGQYILSNKGQQEVDYLSVNRATITRLPKVITYTLLRHGNKMLLFRKPKEPYRNLWSLIGGKVHFGEDTAHAARRSVREKTGLEVELPRHCGVANIIIYKDNAPLSHVIAYVHTVDLQGLPGTMPPGLNAIALSEMHKYPLSPDLEPIVQHINTATTPFVEQIRCHIEDK
jgi:ADP-ribose pyrophosphatase YjhB (NUDIX family)